MHSLPGYADRIYGHAVRDSEGRQWLQYWFFYYYNDKSFLGIGLHEGDWEMIQIGLDSEGEPELVTLSQHKSGERCFWSELELSDTPDGAAPVIYVARGSHANHIAPGEYEAPVVPDYCDGGGALVRPALEEINDGGPPWALWPGVWGSTKAGSALESNSPRGPHTKGQWKDPAGYHAKATPLDKVQERAEAAESHPAPPTPILKVQRDGHQALIAYSFPSLGPGDADPAKLVLTLDSPDDRLPAASYTFSVSEETGSEEHPLPLEDNKRYEVRASAYSADGYPSPVTAISLERPALP